MKSVLVQSVKLVCFFCMLLLLGACSSKDLMEDFEIEESVRVIRFSGFDWVVRTTQERKHGPGPNLFSDSEENVWLDTKGRLHLKIVQKNGQWYCSGVSLRRSMGYGKYVFYVSTKLAEFDPNVVAGLFTYMNDEEEIDIEFSKWADPENKDAQFAVQPSHKAGNKVRFSLDLWTEHSTHAFNWTPQKINFISLQGHDLNAVQENVIHEWSYTGKDIPPNTEERLKINLWLFKGQAPTDLKEQELIIEGVEYIEMSSM